jgi:hypothetical protein
MMHAGISVTSELKSVIQTNEKFRLKFEERTLEGKTKEITIDVDKTKGEVTDYTVYEK